MSHLELIVRLCAGVGLVFTNAFFVVTEFALTRIPQYDESEFQDSPGLRRAWEMTDRLEIYLTGCQLGITASSIVLGIVAEPAITELIRPVVEAVNLGAGTTSAVSIVLAVVLINLIHKIWGEQAPTYLGVEKPITVARVAAPALYWWTKIMYPFIILGDGLAKKTLGLFGITITRSWTEAEGAGEEASGDVRGRADLKRKVASLMRAEDLPNDRQQEVLNTLKIGERPITDIMIPRDEVVALTTSGSAEQNRQIMAEHMFVRFPLTNGSLDNVLGIIYVPALLSDGDGMQRDGVSLKNLAVPPVRVPDDMTISGFIDHLQEQEQELALVEKDGDMVGLVTITDAFEAITGEVDDPLD